MCYRGQDEMSNAFHSQLVEETRADIAALDELRKHIRGLWGIMSTARRADVDEIRRQFAALREEFQTLHDQDMEHDLDRDAHVSWRARVKCLLVRIDQVAGHPVSEPAASGSGGLTTLTEFSRRLWGGH